VNRLLSPALLLRLLLVSACFAFSGIAPRPHAISSGMQKARAAMTSGEPESASAELAKLATQLPWRTDLWESAGEAAYQAENLAAANAYFRNAAAGGSLSAAGYLALGDAQREAGELASALQAWLQALATGGPTEALHTRLADAYLQLGQYDLATSQLQALARLQPTDAALHYQIGLLLAATSPFAAPAYLTQASALDPARAPAAQELQRRLASARWADDPAYTLLEAGRSLAALGEWELAGEAFRRATLARPDYPEAWAYLGEARQHLRSSDRPLLPTVTTTNDQDRPGFAELQQAHRLDPASISANTFLALFYQRQERYDLALVYLYAAATIEPQNPVFQAEIGNNLALMGNLLAAQRHYEQATRLAPRDPATWRQLANFSVVYEIQLRTLGLPAARQAVLLDPHDPASLDTLAQVFILLNDPYSAERFLQRALAGDPAYAPAHLHLGIVWLLTGKTESALEQLKLAQDLAGDNTQIAEQARRLTQESLR
jgi:tetratricopeptide (TPR) repeat protein